MSIEDFYDSTAVVTQAVKSTNTMGGIKKTYATRISALLCRVTARSATERDEFGKLTVREVWRLYCAATASNKAIAASDRVTIGDTTFEIQGIRNPGLQDHHLEIDMLEVA